MDDIERIARTLSDRWFVFVDFRYTYHWEVIADALLSVEAGLTLMGCREFAAKMELASHAELVVFIGFVEEMIAEQEEH